MHRPIRAKWKPSTLDGSTTNESKRRSANPGIGASFSELNIPRSTIRSWIHHGTTDLVSCDSVDNERAELVDEIEKLRRRTALIGTIVGLLNALLRVSKVQLDYERLSNSDTKRILLRAIERAGKVLPLNAALRITRLSESRDHSGAARRPGAIRMITRAAHESSLHA
jgi:hypothetical protein